MFVTLFNILYSLLIIYLLRNTLSEACVDGRAYFFNFVDKNIYVLVSDSTGFSYHGFDNTLPLQTTTMKYCI